MLSTAEQDLAARVAESVHAAKPDRAAEYVIDFCHLQVSKQEAKQPEIVLSHYLHVLLETGGIAEAARILWTPNQFTAEPASVQQVWTLFDESDTGLIMGAASLGKSFSMGVRLFLEWLRDPEWTSVRVLGPSENHLEQNLFSHLVALHNHATLPMPGEIGGLFIGVNRRDQLGSIRGVVIPKGSARKAGRLQGGHRRPRPVPHPVFGELSRMFIFIDEIENVPSSVWQDIDNVLSDLGKGAGGFKVFGAYNPTNSTDEVAKRAEPPWGWASFDVDSHFRWKSVRKWDVLRLDGERCENVIQGRTIYTGLQTREGLERIAANAGGRQSPGYMTMGRGAYPSVGMEITVIPSGLLNKMRGEFVWYEDPIPVGAVDPALEGRDDAIYTLGQWGRVSGVKWPPSIEFPQGHKTMFKNAQGAIVPRWGLQADQQFVLTKGETVAMKTQIMEINRKAGVRPEWFAIDRTGHGAGIADLIKYEWGIGIHDVNYSDGASDDKLMMEDSKKCNELYERMHSELWFALRMWAEFTYFLINPALDLGKLAQQLTNRKFRSASGRSKVEAKRDYTSRGFLSPNEADSITLLVHAARKGSGLILSMRGESVELPDGFGGDDEYWPGGANGVFIDETNRTDYLQV